MSIPRMTGLNYKFVEEQLSLSITAGEVTITQCDPEVRKHSLTGYGYSIDLSPSQARFFGFGEEAQLAEEMARAETKAKMTGRRHKAEIGVMQRLLDCLGPSGGR